MDQNKLLYLEDFRLGERRELGRRSVTEDEIVRFAREFDPQPFHIDREAAAKSIYGGIIASGWHTCAMTMRVMVDGFMNRAASLGSPGVDEVRWRFPVRPGDTLVIYQTPLELRPSKSKPDRGLLISQVEAVNQTGDLVFSMRSMAFFKRRPVTA